MRLKRALGFLLAVIVVLASCTIPNSGQIKATHAPGLASMKIGFDDRTHAQYPNSETTVFINFLLELEEPARHADIDQILILDPGDGYWIVDGEYLAESWDPDSNRFGIWSGSFPNNPDSIPLGEYLVVIVEDGKYNSEYAMTAFNNNNPNESTGEVFSHAVADTPKFVVAPETITAEKIVDQSVIKVSATGVSENYYGVFFWLYDANSEPLGVYEIAWPLTESEIPEFSIEKVVTESQITDTASIVVGFLAEKPLPDSTRFMMYRYFHSITL